MAWDFAEANPLSSSSGSWLVVADGIRGWLPQLLAPSIGHQVSRSMQMLKTQTVSLSKVISADPPYYDNIGYADLSDFFYVWLRRSLRSSSRISLPRWPCLRPGTYCHAVPPRQQGEGRGVFWMA